MASSQPRPISSSADRLKICCTVRLLNTTQPLASAESKPSGRAAAREWKRSVPGVEHVRRGWTSSVMSRTRSTTPPSLSSSRRVHDGDLEGAPAIVGPPAAGVNRLAELGLVAGPLDHGEHGRHVVGMHTLGDGLTELVVAVAEGQAFGRRDDLASRGEEQDELGPVPAEGGSDLVEFSTWLARPLAGQFRLRHEGVLPLHRRVRSRNLGQKAQTKWVYGPDEVVRRRTSAATAVRSAAGTRSSAGGCRPSTPTGPGSTGGPGTGWRRRAPWRAAA